jgi:hypothetical protein
MAVAVRGGTPLGLTVNGKTFDIAADANPTVMTGGFENEAAITGNGNLHVNRNRKLAGFEGLDISIDPSRGDFEYLQQLADNGEPVNVVLTLASGKSYGGFLSVDSTLEYAGGDGTASLSMHGKKFEALN